MQIEGRSDGTAATEIASKDENSMAAPGRMREADSREPSAFDLAGAAGVDRPAIKDPPAAFFLAGFEENQNRYTRPISEKLDFS